jgi:hypothetical protein
MPMILAMQTNASNATDASNASNATDASNTADTADTANATDASNTADTANTANATDANDTAKLTDGDAAVDIMAIPIPIRHTDPSSSLKKDHGSYHDPSYPDVNQVRKNRARFDRWYQVL